MNQVDSVINYADSISLSVNNMSISSSKESEKKDSEAHYMTIEELADYIGMSVRNIRAYNSAGMLPPITLRGRLGLYGTEHTARLEVIRSLREQGFGLERIKQILQNESRMPAHADAWMAAQSHILNVIGQSNSNSETVQTEVIEQDWDQQLTPEVAQKLQQSGILRIHEDGSMEHLAPGLRPLGNRLASIVSFANERHEGLFGHAPNSFGLIFNRQSAFGFNGFRPGRRSRQGLTSCRSFGENASRQR